MPAAEYEQGEDLLAPGDLLVLFTDGITEACDEAEEEFGQERLLEACVEFRACPLAEIAAQLEERLARFTTGAPLSDDRTLMLLRRRLP
jgi:serine phosphatase RsbU (regulator of sigma subunit)